MRVHLGRRQRHLVCVVIAGYQHATQHVAHLRLIIDKLQQRFAVCALLTDAEDILGGRVQANDQQVVVQQDDAGAQTFENSPGIATEGSVVIESAAVGVAAGRVV